MQEHALDEGSPVLAFATSADQLADFAGLMRGGCALESLLVYSGEACGVLDELQKEFPTKHKSTPGLLRGHASFVSVGLWDGTVAKLKWESCLWTLTWISSLRKNSRSAVRGISGR